MEELFATLDDDGGGYLSLTELRDGLNVLKVSPSRTAESRNMPSHSVTFDGMHMRNLQVSPAPRVTCRYVPWYTLQERADKLKKDVRARLKQAEATKQKVTAAGLEPAICGLHLPNPGLTNVEPPLQILPK